MIRDKSHRYEIVTRNEIASMKIATGYLYGLICD